MHVRRIFSVLASKVKNIRISQFAGKLKSFLHIGNRVLNIHSSIVFEPSTNLELIPISKIILLENCQLCKICF